ncbi:MAG: hypothetical protein K2M60_08915 [Lachnospiraceae bacterium]|nr:hypothetical protein [Lachnospiraceae bacterium]MDE6253289.1 hypothetical protein [Lachnospiraceae bacterium]
MKDFLYIIVEIIAQIHNKILSLNDSYENVMDDKQLHFVVIGILGMLMLFIVYPLFKWLSKNHVLVIAWIYVFTVIIVITFAIEIGQKVTGTGNMEFADIASGLLGFMFMFIIFAGIRWLIHMIVDLFKQ